MVLTMLLNKQQKRSHQSNIIAKYLQVQIEVLLTKALLDYYKKLTASSNLRKHNVKRKNKN